MFSLAQLAVPVVQAPMAGGPVTPELAAAVCTVGGLGSLPAGYLSTAELAANIGALRALTERPFHVNLFVPEAVRSDPSAVADYARALRPLAEELGVEPPAPPQPTDDSYGEKLALLVADPVDLVSFTFGLPARADLDRLHGVGTACAATVTSAAEARAARALPIDALIVQGPEAGGHRAVHDQSAQPDSTALTDLVAQVRASTALPLVAGGGIADAGAAAAVLSAGADAVQLGTRFLTVAEAGTKPAHRAALLAGERATVLTRTYSGRPARGLRNRFIDRLSSAEVVGYPEVNTMTGPLRRAAGADPEIMNMWAGEGYRACREQTAAELMAELAHLAPSHS
ncbi:nitronate monooxygenase [Brevibacterium sp. BRM-1]|uniref:nitronate monooxygenase n=1 Tax=Brevibacterium sp. BRM-1 TaxID=2999062 RepID=UPI00227E706E|nr:nitronate monooxygenase [Brevibacterium sp. BRM-1]WAL41167.1 nitronate monooxygenase [Brevibacterium sp. BRM-1]